MAQEHGPGWGLPKVPVSTAQAGQEPVRELRLGAGRGCLVSVG